MGLRSVTAGHLKTTSFRLLAMSIDFRNKLCVITGASSGIGRQFAVELHARGANLLVVARRADLLEQLKSELEGKRENSVQILAADLAKESGPASLESVREAVIRERPFLLINNAGFGSFGFLEQCDLEQERRMVRLNVEALLVLTHAALPAMKESRAGGIIQLSSIAGWQPLPTMATYAATKAFELSLSLALRDELRAFGVRMLAVCPGPVETEFSGVARMPGTMAGGARDQVEQVVADCLKAFDQGRGVVFPGSRGWWLGFAIQFVPLAIRTRLVGWQLRKVLEQAQKISSR